MVPHRCSLSDIYLPDKFFYSGRGAVKLQALSSVESLLTWVDYLCFQVLQGSSSQGKLEMPQINLLLAYTLLQVHQTKPETTGRCSIKHLLTSLSSICSCFSFWSLQVLWFLISDACFLELSSLASFSPYISSFKLMYPF